MQEIKPIEKKQRKVRHKEENEDLIIQFRKSLEDLKNGRIRRVV